MQFAILDSAGNALASYEDALTARAVLHAIVAVEPEACEHVAMLGFDDDGMPVGDAIMAIDVPSAVDVESESAFLFHQTTSGLVREPIGVRTRYVLGAAAALAHR